MPGKVLARFSPTTAGRGDAVLPNAQIHHPDDGLGSNALVNGVDGTILARIGYTFNGEAFALGGSSASGFAGPVVSPEAYLPTDRLRVVFACGQRVSVSPTKRFGAREYAPKTGAWVQPDPYNFAKLSLPN